MKVLAVAWQSYKLNRMERGLMVAFEESCWYNDLFARKPWVNRRIVEVQVIMMLVLCEFDVSTTCDVALTANNTNSRA